MTTSIFLMLLSVFSAITCLITEGIKRIAKDKANLSYNITAIIVALIVGIVGCGIYYQLNSVAFTVNNVIYMMLIGFSSGLVSMVGFDKVKQTIEQIADLIKKN
jgi:RsiW-degrading membrane proteinase PrsW (M82 family)